MLRRAPLGLLGRIFAILLLTSVIEFGVNTFLYERASEFSVREDEARRLAEHLVIAEKLLAEAPAHERPALAAQLTTGRYVVNWGLMAPASPPVTLALDEMRRQVLAWEPALARTDLRLRLDAPGKGGVVVGALKLPDQSWLRFSTVEELRTWDLALGRIVLALVPAAAMILLGGLLLRRTLQPLRALTRAADRIGRGTADPVPEGGTNDVRRLVRAFNAMQTRIHRLIAERTEALAAVGHDLKTPLARLKLRAEAVRDDGAGEALHADIDEMQAMLSSLLDYLGGEEDPEPAVKADLAVLATTLVDDAQDRGFPASYVGPEHCEMRYRPIGMKRALGNLVENALHYAGGVELSLHERGGSVILCVEDRGPGIPEAHITEVLRPFARLDPARSRNTTGLGLGLAIVSRAVEREGGRFDLLPRDGGGLTARIILARR
ncbi:HAMP domain-containing protein [Sphingomonas sp. XMGL2]|uniref:histidine kinase n=1 Tax=Sphingomonas quercus TaxID=2842451 RepID=A0ABS6BJU7_9SPHN|nr:HAMP domain-containing protein [Sphingomonas quercus]